jgi:hypothetical protein
MAGFKRTYLAAISCTGARERSLFLRSRSALWVPLRRGPLTEQAFLAVKADSARVGDVRTFDNFILAVPPEIDLESYKAVIIWCESFGEFITAASYR